MRYRTNEIIIARITFPTVGQHHAIAYVAVIEGITFRFPTFPAIMKWIRRELGIGPVYITDRRMR